MAFGIGGCEKLGRVAEPHDRGGGDWFAIRADASALHRRAGESDRARFIVGEKANGIRSVAAGLKADIDHRLILR